jgi:hypothetical protein
LSLTTTIRVSTAVQMTAQLTQVQKAGLKFLLTSGCEFKSEQDVDQVDSILALM